VVCDGDEVVLASRNGVLVRQSVDSIAVQVGGGGAAVGDLVGPWVWVRGGAGGAAVGDLVGPWVWMRGEAGGCDVGRAGGCRGVRGLVGVYETESVRGYGLARAKSHADAPCLCARPCRSPMRTVCVCSLAHWCALAPI
jgi:hypothetical protein